MKGNLELGIESRAKDLTRGLVGKRYEGGKGEERIGSLSMS